ncbi:DUF2793 domain-containing protein [Thalassorhabdomicrobium marinisediminis]|uniref:DUF2793 domain-containing protein n=1 Tax=Thalassorhabdomicrobium marinisediminis TaxID=2170577 RepID=A0A2T7FZY5_9RHOB|nr:DUF2793 domain-containing protein [Thalassorhabdomicrobium marinisediminis]PVA07742.1 hypothetical protein DC363_03695 [Thalassorhabdomicrobium marinisediminis]
MSQTSSRFHLPYIQPAQAQKHVTHNEALRVLDAVMQLVVETFDATTPPPGPAIGESYGLGAGATADWAGKDTHIAVWNGASWDFVAPQEGWVGWSKQQAGQWRYDGTAWVEMSAGPVDQFGINTSADAVNRLAVASQATLLTHDGAGHQLKINKSAETETVSVLFQSDYTGHAEMGLTGVTDFDIKVSPDGAGWNTVLSAAANGSDVTLAATRITLNGTAEGTAVQAHSADGTAGRILLGGTTALAAGPATLTDMATLDGTRIGGFNNSDSGPHDLTGQGGDRYGMMLQVQRASGRRHRVYQTLSGQMFHQHESDLGMQPARRVFDDRNLLADVGFNGGIPTGGVIESGSTVDGSYTRFADGTQICWSLPQAIDATTASGALFAGQGAVAPFAKPFVAAPVVSASLVAGAAAAWASVRDVTATGFTPLALSSTSTSGLEVVAVAIGRWH